MAYNIDAFKSRGLVWGGARPSLFQVRLSIPTLAKNSDEEEKVRFLAQSVSLPASTIPQLDVYYAGRAVRFAGDRQFENLNMTIVNDEDFKIRAAIEAWMNGINTHISNRRAPAFEGETYKTNATVYQLAKSGNGTSDVGTAIRAYTFSGLFPVSLGAIDLNQAATNTVEMYNISFAYDLWVLGDTEEGDSNSFNGIDGTAVPWSAKLAQE